MIALDRKKRDLSLQEDTIRLAVRDEYRGLEREILSFKIQKASLDLAQTRVESTTALLLAGRAQTRDFLESQTALIQAKNSLTSSLISYAIARQELLRDVEALRVDERGRVTSVSIAVKPALAEAAPQKAGRGVEPSEEAPGAKAE